jgi:uncharacterized OB-fold protein
VTVNSQWNRAARRSGGDRRAVIQASCVGMMEGVQCAFCGEQKVAAIPPTPMCIACGKRQPPVDWRDDRGR